jgi:hypothetical protein
MYSNFQKYFEEYISKINQMIEALEDEADYLQQINDKLSRIHDDWHAIKQCLIDEDTAINVYMENVNTGMDSGYGTTQKEMEQLITSIIKEVNNHHIEFVCLN